MNYEETSNDDVKTATDNLVAIHEQPFSIEPKSVTLKECDDTYKSCMVRAGKSVVAQAECMSNYRTCAGNAKG